MSTKISFPTDTAKKMLGMAGNAAMGAAVGAGVSAGMTGLGMAGAKIYDAITKKHDFNQMLSHNEDLMEEFTKDPKFFNQAYSSLRAANPAYAKDPLIAGHYMRQMVNTPMTAGGIVGNAMGENSPRPSPMMEMWGKGSIEGAKGGLKPPSGGSGRRQVPPAYEQTEND